MIRAIFYRFIYLFFTVIGSVLSVSGVYAQANNFDLLFGLGDFEKCNYSRVLELDTFGVTPTSNLSVANSWTVSIDLAYKDSYICKIVNSSNFTADGRNYIEKGKSYQYVGINNTPGHTQSAEIYISAQSNPNYLDETLHVGDSIILHLDRIISSNFVSGHQSVSIGMFYTVAGDDTQHSKSTVVDLSAGFRDNVEFTLTVPNVTSVRPSISLFLNDRASTGKTTGILLSGAKVFVVRNGKTVVDNEEVPYTRNRTIQTNIVEWYNKSLPLSIAAKNYDHISAMASEYPYFPILRKLNPSIKIYIYQGGMDVNDHIRPARWCVTPFKMDYVVAKHPGWLWPQTNPKLGPDPDSGNEYAAKYLNAGYVDRYWISKVSDKTYQDEWANNVIALAKTVGADGVFIDTCLVLRIERDGALRQTWEVQQFLHGVIPKLRTAGLTSIVNNAQQNLDGLGGWDGDIAEVYYNPSWKPTTALPESAGYSSNTPDNTPDAFFREYSFIGYNFSYSSSYWLRCINDAKIVSAWNAILPKEKAKRIAYSVKQYDTANNPAYDSNGKPGWIPFSLASFLLCNNEFISLGISYPASDGNYVDAMADFSITKRLGIPDGEDKPINDNMYFRMRKYRADGEGASGGIVVVNADTRQSYAFSLPFDAVDDTGKLHLAGSKIEFLPNMGRILIITSPSAEISIELIVSTTSVTPGQTVTITVKYTNIGKAQAKNVLVQAAVPAELEYVTGSAEVSGGSFNSTTNTVSWAISKVAAGETGTRTFVTQVK
ncbi:MAG: hypothetical protein NT018_05310 [Armatimonadetes bacterium]|nr:hypothetical protein [Armatimonadota bacterium]